MSKNKEDKTKKSTGVFVAELGTSMALFTSIVPFMYPNFDISSLYTILCGVGFTSISSIFTYFTIDTVIDYLNKRGE